MKNRFNRLFKPIHISILTPHTITNKHAGGKSPDDGNVKLNIAVYPKLNVTKFLLKQSKT